MPLLKILKGEKTGGSLVPPWHPNFRNFERLPDVKVVRTSFLVNSVAILVALAVLICFGLQEYKLHEIQSGSQQGIDYWQGQIKINERLSEKAVLTYQKFLSAEKKVTEVAAFVKKDFTFSDFIIELGQVLPDDIALNSISIEEDGVSLNGLVRGTSDQASGEAEACILKLRSDPQIGPKFDSISLTSLSRESKADQLVFKIFMKAKTKKKP